MKDKTLKTIRIISLSVSIVLLIFLIVLMLIMRIQSDNRFNLFGYRICTRQSAKSTLNNGDLAIVKVNTEYTLSSQVESKVASDFCIVTAEYAKNIVGKCIYTVPKLGAVINVLVDTPAISSLIFIFFVACSILFTTLSLRPTKSRLKISERIRTSVQILYFAVTNSYIIGFAKGTIYKGQLKNFCVPGLNCYSCPGAYGACPIGAMQAMFTKRDYSGEAVKTAARFPFYVLGLIMLFGVICGRFICGFLCPFGLFQDLLHKIKLPKKLKIKSYAADKYLRYIKYAVLVILVILLPIFTDAAFPWFCKLLCPSGMLIGGIPLMSLNDDVRGAAGSFTILKLSILAVISILSVMIYRPFCKYLCPLGAIYGLLNKVSVLKYSFDESKCNNCNACTNVCPMNVDLKKNIRSAECIRCGRCTKVCPTGALQGLSFKNSSKQKESRVKF